MTQAFNLAQLANNLNTSGQLDATDGLYGALPIANGGTGQTSATAATNALLPSQSGNSGKYLTSDGTNTSWGTISQKITKITQAYASSTRVVYGNNTGNTISGFGFTYPTSAAQTISFTKDSASTGIIIECNFSCGMYYQCHGGMLWKSDQSMSYGFANDGDRAFSSSGKNIVAPIWYITPGSLGTGSHTFYFALGRKNDGAVTGWVLNPNSTDNSDLPGVNTNSSVIVYEYNN